MSATAPVLDAARPGPVPVGHPPAAAAPQRPSPAAGATAPSSSPSPAAGRPVAGDIAVGVGVVLLGLIGFYNSFFTVESAMRESFPGRSWTVPIAIDVGIAVFTGLDLRMASRGDRRVWVRLFPWALNAVTVYLNVAEQDTTAGRVAHGALPVLWIAAVEGVVLLAKRRQAERVKPDKLPGGLWLLAPGPTLLLWRRMRMWGVTSYARATEMDQNRRLVKARLAQQHGRRWQRNAPAEVLELYRQGRLVATDVVVEVPATITTPAPDAAGPGTRTGTPTGTDPGRRPAPARRVEGRRAVTAGVTPEVPAEVLADARALVAEHFGGRVPGRDRLVPLLRSQHGHRLKSEVAAELMRRLKATSATPATAPAAPFDALAQEATP